MRDRVVRRNQVHGVLNGEFWSAYRLWKRWRRFGLPTGAGWLAEPETTIRVLEIIEDEIDLWTAYKKAEKDAENGTQ